MANRKWDALRGSIGFYVTMAVCFAVIGISGYFLLFDKEEKPAAPQESIAPQEVIVQTPATSMTEIIVSDEETAVDVMEVEPIEEVTQQTPQQEVEVVNVTDVPVVAEQPRTVTDPLQGEVVMAFSVDELLYNETLEDWRIHDGVDISAAAGMTVLAACSGTVTDVFDDALMGTTVRIDHNDGYCTTYANLEKEPPVFVGEAVSAGQVIGTVGTTAAAEAAQGPHLHFSVTKDGDVVNPHEFLE